MAKSRTPASTTEKRDRYQEITDKLIGIMEQGRKPWEMPWNGKHAMNFGNPRNPVTGKRYNGINTVLLLANELTWSSGDPRWCTYKQAQAKGWQVKKDAKAETVVFYSRIVKKSENEEEERVIPLLKSYPVFHATQIEGIPEYDFAEYRKPWATIEAADIIMKNSGADLRVGSLAAYYPALDYITMPPVQTFKNAEAYAAVSLHELGHWTGHKDRLDRTLFGQNQNKPEYAKEELRAELASTFICSELGIAPDLENHASYLDSWLRVLKNDKREIFRAAGDAQKIAEYCLNFHPAYKAERDEELKASSPDNASSEETADESMKMAM